MGTQISNFQFSKQIKLNFQHFSLINVLGIMLNKFIFSVLILFNALIFLIGVQNEMIFLVFKQIILVEETQKILQIELESFLG